MMTAHGSRQVLWVAISVAIAACSGSPAPSDIPEQGADSAVEAEAVEAAPESTPAPAATARQIVALTSLTADIIHTLDDDALVGIPGSPILQSDNRFADLPPVSEGRTEPDLETIVALQPDLVIGAKGFHDKILQRLQDLEIETLTTEVDSWASLKRLTQDLAQRIGSDPQPLLERYDACLAQATATAPTALVLVSRQPLLSPNQDSWAGDFLAQFNIANVTADLQGQSPFQGYITLSEETILATNPEALLIVETGDNLLEQLQADAFWNQLNATQTEAVYRFDYFGLVNPGSIASIEATCRKLSQL